MSGRQCNLQQPTMTVIHVWNHQEQAYAIWPCSTPLSLSIADRSKYQSPAHVCHSSPVGFLSKDQWKRASHSPVMRTMGCNIPTLSGSKQSKQEENPGGFLVLIPAVSGAQLFHGFSQSFTRYSSTF